VNVEIPPLRMLRWRSACFGRNDGIRFVIASPYHFLKTKSQMTIVCATPSFRP